jgi:site-specific DNA recombinase
MKPVAIYVRSSKDLHNVSCEAQEEQIRKVIQGNGEEVYRVFCDKALSSTRDVRPEFDKMLSLAMSKEQPFSKIYCLDTSRFGRDQHQTQVLLWQLRKKHGIEVIFVNMPQTGSYLDGVFETIMTAFDQLHSQQSKVRGVASMKQNVLNGYRAGGRAPYGYKLKEFELGKHRHGNRLVKTKLEPDPETAPIVKEYFERRSKGEARMSILEDFYHRGIPSPSSQVKWGTPSAKAIEDNLEVYLGHTVFNRHNERIKEGGRFSGYLHGQKWRPREEWVIGENTHEPLITEEVGNRVREMKAKRIREPRYNAKRSYGLSGVLKCGLCGTNYIGDRGIYRCNSFSKPGNKCENSDISQRRVESALLSLVEQQILNFRNIKEFIRRVKERFKADGYERKPLERKLDQIDAEIRRVMKLYRVGTIDEKEIERELVDVQGRKRELEVKLEEMRSLEEGLAVNDEDIREVIGNFREEADHADPKVRKRLFQDLFREIKIHPKEGNPWSRVLEITGVYIPLTRLKMASPTGFEPVLPT